MEAPLPLAGSSATETAPRASAGATTVPRRHSPSVALPLPAGSVCRTHTVLPLTQGVLRAIVPCGQDCQRLCSPGKDGSVERAGRVQHAEGRPINSLRPE